MFYAEVANAVEIVHRIRASFRSVVSQAAGQTISKRSEAGERGNKVATTLTHREKQQSVSDVSLEGRTQNEYYRSAFTRLSRKPRNRDAVITGFDRTSPSVEICTKKSTKSHIL